MIDCFAVFYARIGYEFNLAFNAIFSNSISHLEK